MCRKFHGAAYATYASVNKNDLKWISGENLLKAYIADNGTRRQFCSNCGSSLSFSTPLAPADTIEIALATLDEDIEFQPDAHIFMAYKANWDNDSDHLPKFTEGRHSQQL